MAMHKLPSWLSTENLDKIHDKTKEFNKLGAGFTQIGLGFVRTNRKTGASLDTSSNCLYECSYCYSKNAPPFLKAGRNTDGIFYDPHTQWCDRHREMFRVFLEGHRSIAKGHFLRLFAHADYDPQYRDFWQEVLIMCREAGVKTVIFTKSPEAPDDLAPLASRMLISRDNSRRWDFGSPEWVGDDDTVNEVMRRHPNVRRVAMVVDEQDIREVEAEFYIAYHGKRSHLGLPKPISQNEVADYVGRDHACSPTHRCYGCPTQCTVNEPDRQTSRAESISLTIGATR